MADTQAQSATGTQWYVKWAHTGSSATSGWHGSIDGPFASNEAPVAGTITVGGQTFPALSGPFGSAAEATSFLAGHAKGPGAESTTNLTAPSFTDPLAGLVEIGHWIGDLVSHLTDAAMWRSIGWLVLGILFIVAGFVWLAKGEITEGLGGVKGLAGELA